MKERQGQKDEQINPILLEQYRTALAREDESPRIGRGPALRDINIYEASKFPETRSVLGVIVDPSTTRQDRELMIDLLYNAQICLKGMEKVSKHPVKEFLKRARNIFRQI